MTLHHLKLAVASRAILSYMAGVIWKCLPCIMVTPSNATAPFQFLILAKAVGKRVFLFWTAGPDNGRQFISGFFDYQLSMSHKIAVQSKHCALHTVISKDDFSKLTVVRAKAFDETATFYHFTQLVNSWISKTNSNDCNFSIRVLKNNSSRNHFWILDCHCQINKSKTAVARNISGFSTVRAIKQWKFFPPCPWHGEGFTQKRQ